MADPEATSLPRPSSRDRATKKGGNGRSSAPGVRSRRRSIGDAGTLRALYEVALAAAEAAEPAEIAGLAVDHARSLLAVDGAVVFVWDDATGLLQPLRETASESAEAPVRPGEGAIGIAFASAEPVIIADYQEWAGAIPDSARRGMVSAVAVPMRVGDRGIGALGVWTYAVRHFTAADVQLLALFGSHIAPAIAAAELHSSLVDSEGRYRSLHQTMAGGLLVQTSQGVVLDANKAAEQMLGLSIDEMRGRPSSELFRVFGEDGNELSRDERPGVKALEDGEPVRGSVLHLERRSGERLWVRADAVPVVNGDGSTPLVVSTIIDITPERRAEEALRESERRFRTIFDHAAIGIARLDLEGCIQETNPALTEMLGVTARELKGRHVSEFILAEDRKPGLFNSFAEGERESFQSEIRLHGAQRGVVWASVTTSLVRDAGDRPSFVVAMVEDISTRKAQEAALAHQALHDALTDLPNRVLLHDRLHHAIRFSQRNGRGTALLLMDLDGFKEINDTFGHLAGDILLRQVSRRLRNLLRASDTVARLGGDEFAIVLPHLSSIEATVQTARKIIAALESPFTIEGERLNISSSIGIALYPDHGGDADTLLRRSDVAMYVAKRSGSGVSVYSPEEDRHSAARLSLVTALRDAIRDRGLVMHYQPKVRLADGCIVGLEALARWRHPELGVIAPDEFIPLAEQAGLIRALGAWALVEVLQQLRRWRTAGVETCVAVNISALQLRDPELPDHLQQLFGEHGVDPAALMLEITESSLMEDPERAIDILRRLTATGVRVSIDDFGTGYSSLAYLRRLPAAELKIDRSLISDVTRSEGDAVIVRSTIELGHNLGMEVVAEGVENVETRRLLTEYGCDLAQGFLFSRPLTAREASLRVRRRAPLGR